MHLRESSFAKCAKCVVAFASYDREEINMLKKAMSNSWRPWQGGQEERGISSTQRNDNEEEMESKSHNSETLWGMARVDRVLEG